MSTSFTRTRTQLAAMVLRKLGILATGGTANSNDQTVIYEAIDLRLKEMHRLGIFWRKVDKVPLNFTLTANTNSASATADILFPIAMQVVDGSRDCPVDIIDVRQYAEIYDKAETGTPTKALWKGGAEFIFWPIPTATTTAKLTYEKIADDSSADAAIDVDVSMLRWMRDIICYDVGDDFNQDAQTMQRFERESIRAELNIRKLNAQRVTYGPVMVDDYYSRNQYHEKDYGA